MASEQQRDLGFQTDFSATELKSRRQKVLEQIDGNAVAVIQGAPLPSGFDPFRQWNEFYYLCGVEVPHAYLLLDGERQASILYLCAGFVPACFHAG